MAIIRGEFYTKKEAVEAMRKISKYCINVKVTEYDYNPSNPLSAEEYENSPIHRDYGGFSSKYSFGAPGLGFMGFPPVIDSFSFGNMIAMDEYGSVYGNYDIPTPRALLEAEVDDEKYHTVKKRLFSHGSISVY